MVGFKSLLNPNLQNMWSARQKASRIAASRRTPDKCSISRSLQSAIMVYTGQLRFISALIAALDKSVLKPATVSGGGTGTDRASGG
jgi:hypothetical protein